MENNLAALSNKELINQLEKLVAHEKKTTAEIVRHLSEVEDRKLYLELGYSSMFDYATRGLGYSNTGAARRIRVARAGTKVPEIFHYLAKEEVSLSALDACSGVLVKEDGAQMLEALRGMSREEAGWLSAFHNPVSSSSSKDKIKKVVGGSSPTPRTDLFSTTRFFGIYGARTLLSHATKKQILKKILPYFLTNQLKHHHRPPNTGQWVVEFGEEESL